jgi:hypothetical protein
MLASLSLQAHQVIEEENMLEAFDMIELYCNRLIQHAVQLDKPQYVYFLHPDNIGVDFVLMFGNIDSLQVYGCLTILLCLVSATRTLGRRPLGFLVSQNSS